jgi:integrase
VAKKWSVTKDPKSDSWIIAFSYRDEKGRSCRYRRSAGRGTTFREAEQQAAKLFRERDRDPRAFVEKFAQPVAGPEPVCFSRLADRWFSEHVALRLRPSTRRTHEQILRVHLVAYFGDRDAREITANDVRAYVASRAAAGLSAKSINNHLSVLHSLFDYGKELEMLDDNPVRGKHKMKVESRAGEWLTLDESSVYLDHVRHHDPEFLLFFTLALQCGMRLGELLGLTWKRIDLGNRRIVVSENLVRGELGATKGNRVRNVAISAGTVDILALQRPPRARPEDLVFRRPDGEPLTRDIVKHPHARAAVAAGRPDLRVHDLRHSFASQLVAEGTPLTVVQQLLGHTDIKTTTRYLHGAEDQAAVWIARLEEKRRAAPHLALVG